MLDTSDDLNERLSQARQLHNGGNEALRMWNCYEVQHLLTLLEFDDLTGEEVITLAYTLAQAYGRKLLTGTPPTLRLVPESPDRTKHLAS